MNTGIQKFSKKPYEKYSRDAYRTPWMWSLRLHLLLFSSIILTLTHLLTKALM